MTRLMSVLVAGPIPAGLVYVDIGLALTSALR